MKGALDRQGTLRIVRRVLAADLACEEECFEREGVYFFERREREGRRRFPRRLDRPFVSMATMGKGVVVTCSADRLAWAKENLGGLERDEVFSARVLARVQSFVEPDDQVIYGLNLLHVCFPDSLREIAAPEGVSLSEVDSDSIAKISPRDGFRHALGTRPRTDRPNVLATTAALGNAIVGIAAASADSDDLWQVGVDVLAPYRDRGIGKALVHRLTSAICAHGKVPYYATLASNLSSRNVANSVGYAPCWIEAGSFERERLRGS